MELKECPACGHNEKIKREDLDCKKCNGTGRLLPEGIEEQPAEYGPGSGQKVAIMAQRYSAGLPLQMAGDCLLPEPDGLAGRPQDC